MSDQIRRTVAALGDVWRFVRIPPADGQRTKGPRLANWQRTTFTADDFVDGDNLGVQTGRASGGLTDVDLDCPEAIALATHYLPATGLSHGRSGARSSHRWYVTTDPKSTIKLTDPGRSNGKATIVELRCGDHSHQTMIPPSIHPNGELLEWERSGDGIPSTLAYGALEAAVRRLGAAVLLARYWPDSGARHQASLALCGMLARAGWSVDEIAAFVTPICAHVNGDDGEPRKRHGQARDSVTAAAEGRNVVGLPTLINELGMPEAVVSRVNDWLRITRVVAPPAPSNTPTPVAPPTSTPRATDVDSGECEVHIQAVAAEVAAMTTIPVVSTSFGNLDRALDGGIEANSILVVTSGTGKGKTSWLLTPALAHARHSPVIIYAGEGTRAMIVSRLVAQILGVPWKSVRSGAVSQEMVDRTLSGLDIRIITSQPNPTEAIRGAVERALRDRPGRTPLLCVDYVQVMLSGVIKDLRVALMMEFQALRRLVESMPIACIALSQTSRAGAARLRDGEGSAEDFVDTAAETAAIEQGAAGVLNLSFRSEDGGTKHVVCGMVSKSRYRGPSQIGFEFDGPTGRWTELAHAPVNSRQAEIEREIVVQLLRHAAHTCSDNNTFCGDPALTKSRLAKKNLKRKDPHYLGHAPQEVFAAVNRMLGNGKIKETPGGLVLTTDGSE